MKKIVLWLIATCFAAASWAGTGGDYRAKAEETQYNLGFCYYSGVGVNEDKSKALYWFRESVLSGLDWKIESEAMSAIRGLEAAGYKPLKE